MATAIFAGITTRYVPPLRGLLTREAEMFPNWTFNFVPRNGKEPLLLAQDVNEIERLANSRADVHVFGWAPPSKPNAAAAAYLKQFFRFRWFPMYLLSDLGSPNPTDLLMTLRDSLLEEEQWDSRVKPRSLLSPLLLPAPSFGCGSRHAELWRHASAYGDEDNIHGAELAVADFQSNYLRRIILSGSQRSKWVDDSSLIFNDDGPRHAVPPPPRSWKFSYRFVDGFHYDVTHEHERKFSLCDAAGESHKAKVREHINVDPHGFVRGS